MTDSETADQPPAARTTGAAPAHGDSDEQLLYEGRFGEILVLFLTNVVLNILTLGFYRFWGKTRIRRYIWSHMRLGESRFEYCGFGLEIFVSFMIIFAIFYLPFIGLLIWLQVDPPYQNQLSNLILLNLVVIGGFLILFVLYYVALFAAYRYRISRTMWRGIRGSMHGSPFVYGCLGAGLGVLNVFSLGWTKPWADLVAFKWRLDRARFGDRQLRSRMGCGNLYVPFLVAWFVTAVAVIVTYGILIALITEAMLRGRRLSPAEIALLEYMHLAGYLVILFVWQLSSIWYKAVFLRNLAGTARLAHMSFRTGFSAGQLFWLKVPNFLLLLVTLGLAFPYTVHRTARFLARHLKMSGERRISQLRQGPKDAPKLGDGLAEFVGFGGL